ncbi:oxygen-independent coproporphyrinogen III oxidase-like protein [Polynucleobacter paneuropaeus]|uniref:radical SAM family heme chaperone HemW n=1 Tax=Polynucleobacter paneuropaeus TaxID=2527775 RepID=UPI000DBF24FF|nr:radical SAM family heme chaperone HemW [Polynucleobacter paneuropaeus]AWW46317.1 oxygen-independent coproporphyrinogen III oxidase-like protein [Polynucleobacter paneuropaeus]MBT8563145.1 oxygen-independent coproporphyrinogen III oxidase-like protein [Polynucleobacter paneuropaeus]MBT8572614.1 oxygen-independent coproporphyrinogen III oxidase-like protein [Polynucleobacter paneuropaeus]QWC97898.1 oxygen-independent coproporphyrinogen III oxidase-like protein [Polynucleobacter paneuropaeus]Q
MSSSILLRPQFTALPPLALYIHFPWCERKCPYCDFNSHQIKDGKNGFDEVRYLKALIADLETELPRIWGRQVHSIFIGGGTPSLLSGAGMQELLSAVRARINLEPDAEITMEANPGSVEAEKFSAFAKAGINRVSLGIQSFQDEQLKALGRIHNGKEARAAIAIALEHFKSVNIDLMYGLPKQTLEQARDDIETALSFNTPHLSLYNLTLEPNTYFASFPPQLPDEEMIDAIFEQNLALLGKAGYQRYEVSAYAKKGQECKHNLNYWRFGDYIGIGAGAHGKISFPDKVTRQLREKHPEQYMQAMETQGHALLEARDIAAQDLPFEFMLNVLRLSEGVQTITFSERTGLPLSMISKELSEASNQGLLDTNPTLLKASEQGFRYLNNLQEIFLA